MKKSVRKRWLEPRAFVYSLAHLPFYFRVSIYERLSAHKSASALKVERNCLLVRGTVNRSPDNRGSTVFVIWQSTNYEFPEDDTTVSKHVGGV
jgi:hypothetical protein